MNQYSNIKYARKRLAMTVLLYNIERLHSSIGNLIPEIVHSQYHQIKNKHIKRLWKNCCKKTPVNSI
ncbi:MAG: hypothetical protein FWH53_01905 [Leptospirales bacterium]|nr:hypothetical protein [Leptospirales bacterium]